MNCNSCGSMNIKTEKNCDGDWDYHKCNSCGYFWWSQSKKKKTFKEQ
jgi:uncharacterized Zn finger protein